MKTEIKAKLFDPAAWQSGPRYVADVQVDTENIDSLPLVSLLCMVSACEKDGSIDGEQKCMIKALLLSGHNRKERMGAAMLVRSKSWEKRSVHVNTHADSNRNKDIFDESEEKQKSYGEDMSGFSHGVGSITSAEERTANKLAMENEKVAMESIYGEEYKDLGLADNGLAFIQVQIIHHLIPTKKAFTFDLIFRIFPNYPKVPPTFEVQSVNCLLTDEVYELQQLLLDSAYALLGEVMLFDLTLAAQNFLYEAYMERVRGVVLFIGMRQYVARGLKSYFHIRLLILVQYIL